MAQMNPADREKRLVVRAGLFVALGLFLAAVVIVLIGKERNLFDQQNTYVGAFENVDGLVLDAPVRLGGLQAGRVTKIAFANDLGDKRIIVTMEVVAKFGDRIRRDSVARVTGRGVLGDKAVDISLGSPEAQVVPSGGELATGTSGDISSLLKATGEIIDNAVGITRDLKSGVAAYTSPELQKDVAAVVKSTRSILGEVESGQGAMHVLLYDKQTGGKVKSLLEDASRTAARLDNAAGAVEQLLTEVRDGKGALHALVYDRKISQAVEELGDAASEAAKLMHDAKTSKDGAVYQLVYGDARGMMGDLGTAAADIKAITQKIRAGEGSLGGVINDPTVYEDLKELLGNVKRNAVLRALVRLSISNGDKVEAAGKPKAP
ncbi:MAG: MlaD family protein [Myxococcaceae bacterium]|nr:MlaD family protein [Myxococcaceae bacterium]